MDKKYDGDDVPQCLDIQPFHNVNIFPLHYWDIVISFIISMI